MNALFNELTSFNLLEDVLKMIYEEIDDFLLYKIVPDFWSQFNQRDFNDTNRAAVKKCNFQIFRQAVGELYLNYRRMYKILERIKYLTEKSNGKFTYRFDDVFKSALLSQLPTNFSDIVSDFYAVALKVFLVAKELEEDDDEMEDKIDCNGCENPIARCQCQEFVHAFTETNLCLTRMSLLDRISGFALTNLIQDQISQHVTSKCRGTFDKPHMKNLEIWLDTIVMHWLIRIFNNGSSKIDPTNTKIVESVNYFKIKLNNFLYEKYADTIIEQFFNIIIEFPDSTPAIDDLKLCMEKLDLRAKLIANLRNSIETRLLHPGVETSDIITGYVTTIKAMRHLEKSGILLQTVTEPVKEYLRKGRTDTVRCVITSLIEESPSDLSEELARSEALKAEEAERNADELSNWENWNPDPIDANPDKNSIENKKMDIISMIVDIYGSKELFVNEYRNLLAERLLTQLDFNPDKEIRNLELLKLRFGEILLHGCEVMLKDVTDSKRINAHIQSSAFSNAQPEDMAINTLIVSSQFWPTFKKETMEFPEQINEVFEKYKKAYEDYKGNRTLIWTPLNGKVTIDIEIKDKKMEMVVTPAQATIIIHFQEQKEWELEKLSHKMNVPPSLLKRRIGFWQLQGLIKETRENLFVLCDDDQTAEESMEVQANVVMDEEETAMASANDQREEELSVFWSYIVGMLTNLDSLSLERIHQMLRMFAAGFEFSQDELKGFLQRKVREHKLMYAFNVYQLPKN